MKGIFSVSKDTIDNISNNTGKISMSHFKYKNCSKYVSMDKKKFFEYCKGKIFYSERKSSKSKLKSVA